MRRAFIIHEVIHKNNAAVDQLVKGDFSWASRIFLMSLQLVQKALADAVEESESVSHRNNRDVVSTLAVQIPLTPDQSCLIFSCQKNPWNPQKSSAEQEGEKKKTDCMELITRDDDDAETHHRRKYAVGFYQYAIKIVPSRNLTIFTKACEAMAGIITFNLGQVYLIQSLSNYSGVSIRSLEQARSLYERSYRLTTEYGVASVMDSGRVMGTLSNLALANHLLNNEGNADQCLQTLLAVIVYLRQYHEEWNAARQSEHEPSFADMHTQFLETMALFVLREALTAPAA